MHIRQLFDQNSGTYSYLVFDADKHEGVFIDTVYEQHERDLALVRELNIKLHACLETHCHADHVTGAWLMRQATHCEIAVSADSGIHAPDRALHEGDCIVFGSETLQVISTPGHTNGCISFVSKDSLIVFTGDTLLIRGCGRTDFQQGSASRLYDSIRHKLFSLPDECIVYPGHDYAGRTSSTIGEEKMLNPRIGGEANQSDFAGYMENMHLPHPKKLDIAVPANLALGKPDADKLPQKVTWAPVITTFSGILKITPEWVASHLSAVTVLDVRSEAEYQEENGGIAGALHIPISSLTDRIAEVPEDKPVMTICRSGKRSALACQILQQSGYSQVANIDGGIIRWQAEGLPLTHHG